MGSGVRMTATDLTLRKMKQIAAIGARPTASPAQQHEAAVLLRELLDDLSCYCVEYRVSHDIADPVEHLVDALFWSAHVMEPPGLDTPEKLTRQQKTTIHAEQMKQRIKGTDR